MGQKPRPEGGGRAERRSHTVVSPQWLGRKKTVGGLCEAGGHPSAHLMWKDSRV